jgi:aminoglycoside phosphotransferase (APT) family kinase protein
VSDLPPADDGPDERHLIEQLQADLGGEVVALRRQARWRPAWFVDLERDGQLFELYVRGARTDMHPIFPLEHERRMQEQLGSMGIPVPVVRGYLRDPPAIVMDRAHGNTDFTGCSDDERRSVMDEYVQILARLHRLAVGTFAEAGAELSDQPSDAALTGIRAYERAYRVEKVRPDPFMEFCLGWLGRNPPRHRVRPSVVVWDSGQFLHRHGRISALLDLELAHIGDPMMDLAGLRMRSSVIDYGPLDDLYRRYEDLTGDEVDPGAIAYHHFAFALTTQLAYHRGLVEPTSDSDLMTYMHWCSESNLYAVEALAGFVGIELEKVALSEPSPSPSAVAHRHLVDSLRAMAGSDERSAYQLRIAFRLARHLQRVDAIGASIIEHDLDDVAAIIGHRPSTWVESERELERFVIGADPGFDRPLIRLFHRRLERQRTLLGPEGSAMTRHRPLPPIGAPPAREPVPGPNPV